MPESNKPSFLSSLASGITGAVKGLLAGGVVGAAIGATVGAIVGIATGGFAWTAIAPAMKIGAMLGAEVMGAIGITAGTVTGVVKSREAAAPSAEDIVNVAKVSFAQGVAVGREAELAEAQTNVFRDRITQSRQNPAQRTH